ncbi:DUF3761 domain-containing protein [Xenorhabdus szentirmaii]|uniref:DUF3761 domain-containing protein n=1 Tax=Xenorhabdus szentirmaii TaxID=290112 RepID=UPI002B401933|nr:DUF3761 domain-containing protein [Xenorhabdus sp. ZM]
MSFLAFHQNKNPKQQKLKDINSPYVKFVIISFDTILQTARVDFWFKYSNQRINMMKNLKLSVAALLVLFSSAALAVPAVSTSAEPVSKTVTAVKHDVEAAKNKVSSAKKKVTKKASVKKVSKHKNKSAKKGANTALCKDGTYSKSKSRKGACSRHGGVSKWL